MKIDRRLTNGLAWAGALLVVAIPTADLLSAQFAGVPAQPPRASVASIVAPVPAPASQRPAVPATPVEVAAVAKPAEPLSPQPVTEAVEPTVVAANPAVQQKPVAPTEPTKTAVAAADAVDAYLRSGKAMPSYISDGMSAKPAAVAVTSPSRPPITGGPVPAVDVDPIEVAAIPKVAPTPMPLSMRPAPVSTPVAVAPPSEPIVIPPMVGAPVPPANVSAADLEEWESGPLSEFLAKRQGTYDSDGFFLDEGPNMRPRRDRIIGPIGGGVWFAD